MRFARNFFSALVLSVLASACAGGVSGNRSPEPYQFTSVQPSRASSVVAPLAQVNHDGGGWSNIWAAQAQLADRPNVAR
jgi:hypothetical protein